jgi:hypothetical protein
MDSRELDGKILYFEMHTHPPDKSALYFTKGWARINALSGGYVTVSWPDYPGANSAKSVTLKPEIVAQFRRNDLGETFELMPGKPVKPDFIYIEQPVRDAL